MARGDAEKAQRITDIFHQASSTTDNQTYDMSSVKTRDIDTATLSAFMDGTINTINIGPLTVVHGSVSSYTVSGKVIDASGNNLSGVNITITGAITTVTTTGNDGTYSSTALQNGSYTVTPSFSGYTFSPASRLITVSGANLTGQDFTAAPATYSISGKITLSGAGILGVTVSLTGASTTSATTDANGNYAFAGVVNGSYTITPSKAGYTFTPSTSSITVNNAAVTVPEITAGIYVPPQFAYVANSHSGTISVYTINQTTGALTSGFAVAAGTYPRSIAVDPSRKFAYVANEGSGGGYGTISVYTIDQTTGALTPGTALTIYSGPDTIQAPQSIVVHPSGKFAYTANGNLGTVTAYSINQTTGDLTPGTAVAAGAAPYSVAVSPSGKFAYATNSGSNNISVYIIEQTTGALTEGTTVSAGDYPTSITTTGAIQ